MKDEDILPKDGSTMINQVAMDYPYIDVPKDSVLANVSDFAFRLYCYAILVLEDFSQKGAAEAFGVSLNTIEVCLNQLVQAGLLKIKNDDYWIV